MLLKSNEDSYVRSDSPDRLTPVENPKCFEAAPLLLVLPDCVSFSSQEAISTAVPKELGFTFYDNPL